MVEEGETCIPQYDKLVRDRIPEIIKNEGKRLTVTTVTWALAELGQVGSFFYGRRQVLKRAIREAGQVQATS